MVGDVEVGLEVGIADLLEVDCKFGLDLLGEVEEVELVTLFLGEHSVHELLELLGTGSGRHFEHPQRLPPAVTEVNKHILGDLYWCLLCFLYFLAGLHSTINYN